MAATATKTPCPTPPTFTYTRRVPQPDGTIVVRTIGDVRGQPGRNGFYGSGVDQRPDGAVGH